MYNAEKIQEIKSEQDNIDNIVKLKFLLRSLKANLSEINNITITATNSELQRIKKDIDTSLITKDNNINSVSEYISGQIEKYLENNCHHEYIEDIYDIGEDDFKKVRYCCKCYHGY